jgi:hypothetical protein
MSLCRAHASINRNVIQGTLRLEGNDFPRVIVVSREPKLRMMVSARAGCLNRFGLRRHVFARETSAADRV